MLSDNQDAVYSSAPMSPMRLVLIFFVATLYLDANITFIVTGTTGISLLKRATVKCN